MSRWYDANQVTPVFPFGHGLSYTTFSYGTVAVAHIPVHKDNTDIKAAVAEVTLSVTNSGQRDGAEVVQLYLAFPASAVGEPPKQLKAFTKVAVPVGQTVQVKFTLTQRDISTWDSHVHAWVPARGEFGIMVGASAADIRTSTTILL